MIYVKNINIGHVCWKVDALSAPRPILKYRD